MAVRQFLVWTLLALVAEASLMIDRTKLGHQYDGIGGLSGGGATSRLLVDYKEPQRGEVLDYLFKPNFGASLQILKVEIGGDSQSTDGTETSHMHSEDDLDFNRGYEWWLMVEAKKRNPEIKLYGLAWAYPGWVGRGSGSPFTYPNLTATYITNWIKGAHDVYGLTIDYIGIWNERASDSTYVRTLRAMLDNQGFGHTQIVAQDGNMDVCKAMAKDPEYAKAVSIIGIHYPSDYSDYSVCHSFGKPVWASEESSSYDDLNGAACWARVITSHWVLAGLTSSIMWNLVGSYFHGTEWYASSMLTAVEPWSGHYEINPVIWATAHVTQFTKIGWAYLLDDSGSGQLPKGGFYASIVDPDSNDFTLTAVKIDHTHAYCTRPSLPGFSVAAEKVTFTLADSMGSVTRLAVWYSNFQNYTASPPMFQRLPDIAIGANRSFTIDMPVGAFVTVTTVTTATKGTHGPPPESVARFPLPYADNFDKYPDSQEAAYWSDQIGAFEIHPDESNPGSKLMRQMVPTLPIGWSDHGSLGPVTILGMREWQDLTVQVSFRVPVGAKGAAGCVATRSDQMWANGVVFCAYTESNEWTVSIGGPSQDTGKPTTVLASGNTPSTVTYGDWHTISITTVDLMVSSASFNGQTVLSTLPVRNTDTGFAAFGSNGWFAVEYDNVSITAAGSRWDAHDHCPPAQPSTQLVATPCTTNGLSVASQRFELHADYTLRHSASGLCATAAPKADVGVYLAACNSTDARQQFFNDYTRIRNTPTTMTYQASPSLKLCGELSGEVHLSTGAAAWDQWVYFPNTLQLRNQYVAEPRLGYPLCLSTC